MINFFKNKKAKLTPADFIQPMYSLCEEADQIETKARAAIWDLELAKQDLELAIPAFVWGLKAKDYQRLINLSKKLRKQAKAVDKAVRNLKDIKTIGVNYE